MPFFCHKQRDGRSVYWPSFDTSKTGELKVPSAFLIHAHQCCGPRTWAAVPGSLYSPSSPRGSGFTWGLGIECGYHLPSNGAGPDVKMEVSWWTSMSCALQGSVHHTQSQSEKHDEVGEGFLPRAEPSSVWAPLNIFPAVAKQREQPRNRGPRRWHHADREGPPQSQQEKQRCIFWFHCMCTWKRLQIYCDSGFH